MEKQTPGQKLAQLWIDDRKSSSDQRERSLDSDKRLRPGDTPNTTTKLLADTIANLEVLGKNIALLKRDVNETLCGIDGQSALSPIMPKPRPYLLAPTGMDHSQEVDQLLCEFSATVAKMNRVTAASAKEVDESMPFGIPEGQAIRGIIRHPLVIYMQKLAALNQELQGELKFVNDAMDIYRLRLPYKDGCKPSGVSRIPSHEEAKCAEAAKKNVKAAAAKQAQRVRKGG